MSEQALAWAAEQLGSPVVDVRPLVGGRTSTMLALGDAAGGQSVLRLITEEPWRTHGAGLAAREAQVQEQLATRSVPAPHSLALDAEGDEAGHPAHLMTLLPGRVDRGRASEQDLLQLARLLAKIHAVEVDPPPRDYQPWAFEEKYVVPAWASSPGPWHEAFDLLRDEPPSYDPTFLHRDPHLGNVLWDGPRISGVVDWVETSTGPAWLDVAHCRTNLAVDHGSEVADRFGELYAALTGREPEPWWDVLDAVGFLPRPGTPDFTDDPARLARLDAHLGHLLAGW